MPLAQPVLNLLGPLHDPIATAAVLAASPLICGTARTVLSLQQSGQTTGLECVHPVEKSTATDVQLLGNLRRSHLSAGGQSRRAGAAGFSHPCKSATHQRQPAPNQAVQMVSLRIPLFACLPKIVQSQTEMVLELVELALRKTFIANGMCFC